MFSEIHWQQTFNEFELQAWQFYDDLLNHGWSDFTAMAWQQWALPILGIFALSIPYMVLEHFFPRRKIEFRRVFIFDLMHVMAAIALSIPIGRIVYGQVLNRAQEAHLFDFVPRMPIWLIIPITLIGIDFSLYWIHRAMHTNAFWRIHRWHHSPDHMYWLAGLRASFWHDFLFVCNSLLWTTAMRMPPELYPIGASAAVISNNWMHTNLKWNWPRLEKIIITPRTHSVHHAKNPSHHNGNYGAFLSIWDHMLGTYVNPEPLGDDFELGITDKISVVRLMSGL